MENLELMTVVKVGPISIKKLEEGLELKEVLMRD
jgi:hypothetical protein